MSIGDAWDAKVRGGCCSSLGGWNIAQDRNTFFPNSPYHACFLERHECRFHADKTLLHLRGKICSSADIETLKFIAK